MGEPPCPRCFGDGWIAYGSTATYHGGMGGAAMTPGVCDKCWGSGLEHTIWPSHKEFYSMKRKAAKTSEE